MSDKRKYLPHLQGMIGRTVSGVGGGGCGSTSVAVAFEDGSYIYLVIDTDRDGFSAIDVDKHSPEPNYELICAGVYTKKEYDAHRKSVAKFHAAAHKARERMEFERLLKKFGKEAGV